ncbi:putative Digeranylgeranylglyceryl phosphate synthase [Glarea lozoyensis 74030]|uniref:Putative Digeranylgeranylglyceryl phosphate synthase n=1 Tax=Glarea lozoyensis (strain ATCC 74030 / MF5533) TaxID=1104152 RepID=H0EL58_GLAL7|nr:putative Digeranylgeranylglyceryl phosphate synthase [Glarea lozoyensis 74030]
MLQPLRKTLSFARMIWEFIESDFVTFAVPNSAFGIFGAFASTKLICNDLSTIPSPQSVVEDRINKPWRPIPRGKITCDQTRRLMLVVVPITLALNYYLGAWNQGIAIHILTWLYNDLGGGDEVFVRELIIAIAYGFFNSGSLTIAVGPECSLSALGITWTIIVSGVILTTMQVQDLKDQKGDKTRKHTLILN